MRQIECYFWFDGEDQDSLLAVVRPLCLHCHGQAFPWLGWYYTGQAGPWQYACGKCGEIILDGIVDDPQQEIIED